MKRFLAFYTLIYLRSVETLYHVIIGFCWFHQGPSFSIRMHALLFFSLHPWSRRPLCTDGFFTRTLGSWVHQKLSRSAKNAITSVTEAVVDEAVEVFFRSGSNS